MPRLLDQLRERLRYCRYSLQTGKTCVQWARGLIRFHGRRHPREMSAAQPEAFLSHLVNQRSLSDSTHKQARSAQLLACKRVPGIDLPSMQEIGRPRTPVRLPVVLSRDESQRLLAAISGVHGLLARLLYGTGMREMDCLRLRMKDMDFDQRPIIVRDGRTFERSGSCSGTAASIRRQFSAWSHHHRAGDAGSQSCVIRYCSP